MITPMSLPDPERATDDEIIAAYLEDGFDEETARAYLAVIRGTSPTPVD